MSKNYLMIITLICSFIFLPQNLYSSSYKQDEELQENCRRESEERFKETYGDEITINEKETGVNSYRNHYNKKLKKCFVIFTTTGFTPSNNKTYTKKFLFGLDDNKEYGFFQSNGTFFCKVMKKKCKAENEWDLLVKPYIEE
jgi:hypothetical protein